MVKNCDNCINSGRPSYEWPCTSCTSAYGSAPSKWESIVAKDTNVPSWIPVSERLPEHGKIVLVCGSRGGIYTAFYKGSRYWHKLNSKNHFCEPTHWMPLPEPPKEE